MKSSDNANYKYEYFLTYLADGKFNNTDAKLRVMLNEGWKPLRETPVGGGYVLLVLSQKVEDDSSK